MLTLNRIKNKIKNILKFNRQVITVYTSPSTHIPTLSEKEEFKELEKAIAAAKNKKLSNIDTAIKYGSEDRNDTYQENSVEPGDTSEKFTENYCNIKKNAIDQEISIFFLKKIVYKQCNCYCNNIFCFYVHRQQ